jgi:hypothetical protein
MEVLVKPGHTDTTWVAQPVSQLAEERGGSVGASQVSEENNTLNNTKYLTLRKHQFDDRTFTWALSS